MVVNKDESAVLKTISEQIEKSEHNVIALPKGFPGADEVRANIEKFLKKNQSKVEHLIMIIHE